MLAWILNLGFAAGETASTPVRGSIRAASNIAAITTTSNLQSITADSSISAISATSNYTVQ